MPVDTPPPEPDQRAKPVDGQTLARGVAWFALFRWSAQLISWAAFLVVVRHLAPDEYGIAGLAASVVSVATVIGELGLGTAVVVLPTLSAAQARQVHTISVLAAIFVAGTLAAAAPSFASFFREARLGDALRVLSLAIVAEGLRVVPTALLARALRYRLLAAMEFAKAIVTSVVALVLAVGGAGYWALVLATVAGSTLLTTWMLRAHPLGLRLPEWRALREALSLSANVITGRLAWTTYRQSDFFVAGRMLSTPDVGQYTAAWNLAQLPGEKLGTVITAATQPFFASVQDDRTRLGFYFLQTTQFLAISLLPLLIGLLCVADLVVPLVLGSQWTDAVSPLRWLIVYAVMSSLVMPVSQILNVTGQSRVAMAGSLLGLVVLPPAFVLGARLGGTSGIAIAWAAVFPLVAAYPLLVALRALDISPWSYVQALLRPLEALIAMTAAVWVVRGSIESASPQWLPLALSVVAGGLVYCGILWLRQRELARSVLDVLRNRNS